MALFPSVNHRLFASGQVKYQLVASNGHGLFFSNPVGYDSTHNALELGDSTHRGTGISTVLDSYNTTVGMALSHFFIKPHLVVSEHKEDYTVTEVRVQIGKRVGTPQKKRKAHFTFLAIENKGRETAEDVVPFIKLIKDPPDLLYHKAPIQLTIITDPQKPWITCKWPEGIGKFSDHEEPWPTVLVHDERLDIRKESVTIYGKDVPIPFVLFFAFKREKVLYLPAPQNIAIKMPRKFQFTVCLRAKHLPFKEVKTYEVDAKDWNDFPITEV